jgi:cytochrome P450
VCRYALRLGDRVALFPPLLHFDESRVGANADSFDPDRYLERPQTPLMPFGGGSSLCPGRKFARREIKAFVIHILSRFSVVLEDPNAPVPASDPTRIGLGVIGPAPGQDARVIFTPRTASASASASSDTRAARLSSSQ